MKYRARTLDRMDEASLLQLRFRDLELPRGFRLSARGEFQGGHYISDSASNFCRLRSICRRISAP